ncbi:hypothetical protein ACP70R_049475 [Stipagrostis hirtigluma subsp. patula]
MVPDSILSVTQNRWMVILDKQLAGRPPSTHNEDRPLNLKAQGDKEYERHALLLPMTVLRL